MTASLPVQTVRVLRCSGKIPFVPNFRHSGSVPPSDPPDEHQHFHQPLLPVPNVSAPDDTVTAASYQVLQHVHHTNCHQNRHAPIPANPQQRSDEPLYSDTNCQHPAPDSFRNQPYQPRSADFLTGMLPKNPSQLFAYLQIHCQPHKRHAYVP